MTATSLVSCPGCARHVRITEASCPFCANDLDEARKSFRARERPAQRLSRAALYAFGVGVAVACGGSAGAGIGGAGQDAGELDSGQLKEGVDCVNGPNYTGCACSEGAQKACYTGPASTLGVSPCAPGVQRCQSAQEAQLVYGPCEGETLPTTTATCGLAAVDAGGPVDAATEDVMGHAAYGGFPIDAGSSEPDGSFLPPYGHVPFDAAPADTGLGFDAGQSDSGFLAAYGAPPGG
jgi:hypothetical protein